MTKWFSQFFFYYKYLKFLLIVLYIYCIGYNFFFISIDVVEEFIIIYVKNPRGKLLKECFSLNILLVDIK